MTTQLSHNSSLPKPSTVTMIVSTWTLWDRSMPNWEVISGEWTSEQRFPIKLCLLVSMFVTRVNSPLLVSLLHMINICANITLKQALKVKRARKLFPLTFFRNTSAVPCRLIETSMRAHSPNKFSSIVMESVIQWENRSSSTSLISSRRSSLTSTTPRLKEMHFPISHSSSSISAWDRDSSRSQEVLTKHRFSTLPRELMLIMDSSSRQRLLMEDLTSSSCLIQSLKVQLSPLTSTSLRTPLTSLRTLSSTSPMLCATTTTIGQTPLRSLLLACSQTRSPSIAVRSATFLQMLTSTSFPSTCEEVEAGWSDQ